MCGLRVSTMCHVFIRSEPPRPPRYTIHHVLSLKHALLRCVTSVDVFSSAKAFMDFLENISVALIRRYFAFVLKDIVF